MIPATAADDYLAPERKKPRPLTYEQARAMRRPRRCNVPWHRLGGAMCCDLCTCQSFSLKHVACMSSDEPPLFRPRQDADD